MASITFEGPNPLNPAETSKTVLSVPDELLLSVVEAGCTINGYQFTINETDNGKLVYNKDGSISQIANPVGPGTFIIQKTIEVWKSWVVSHKNRLAEIERAKQVQEETEDLMSQIEIK